MVREVGLLAHIEVTQLFPPLNLDVVSSLMPLIALGD